MNNDDVFKEFVKLEEVEVMEWKGWTAVMLKNVDAYVAKKRFSPFFASSRETNLSHILQSVCIYINLYILFYILCAFESFPFTIGFVLNTKDLWRMPPSWRQW